MMKSANLVSSHRSRHTDFLSPVSPNVIDYNTDTIEISILLFSDALSLELYLRFPSPKLFEDVLHEWIFSQNS